MVTIMEDIVLSIVIVTYNHEKYIRQALDSVIMQTMKFSYEIYIGDDASTDKTPLIVEEYAKKYDAITAVCRKENVGANYNAYDLLKRTKGRYIAFLDGDDYWTDKNKLQIQVDFMESHPQYIGCTHRFEVVDENGERKKKQKLSWVKFKETFTLEDFDGVTLPGQASTLVRRNLFVYSDIDMSIIYKTHPLIGDRISILIYLCNGNFAGIDKEMSCYRQVEKKTGQNATSKQYANNDNAIFDEVDLTCKLEQMAYEIFDQKISVEKYKKRLVISAIFQYLRTPTEKRRKAIAYALKHTQRPIALLFEIPILMIKKWKENR